MDYYLGVDIGTTSTKAVLYDEDGRLIDSFSQGYPLYRDPSGMAEQDPEILMNAVFSVIKQGAAAVKLSGGQVLAVSFSSANQSLIALDRDFQPLSRAITWADTRARVVADELKKTPAGRELYRRTGTPIHPMSPLTKLLWLRQAKPDWLAQTAYFGDIKSYLFYRLFHRFKVDISIASCTGMMDLKTGDWDPQALKLTGVTKDQLPVIVNGTTVEQGLIPAAQEATGLTEDTKFVYGAFDGALSNVGVGAVQKNTVAITIGTSAAVRVVTDQPVIDPEERLFCYAVDQDHWVVGGPLNNGGAVFQWAVEHLVDPAAAKNEGVDPYTLANDVIATVPAGSHGLLFHPFLGGERAPLWDANARGSFFGLSQLHTRADMLRAVMEGINMNIATVFGAVTDLVGTPKTVTATGGFANSPVWRQMMADVLNCPVAIPESFESGCLGALVMAMLATGRLKRLEDVSTLLGPVEHYQPTTAAVATYQQYLPLFTRVEQLLTPAYAPIVRLQDQLK